jgi:hypothetical protein
MIKVHIEVAQTSQMGKVIAQISFSYTVTMEIETVEAFQLKGWRDRKESASSGCPNMEASFMMRQLVSNSA